MQQAST